MFLNVINIFQNPLCRTRRAAQWQGFTYARLWVQFSQTKPISENKIHLNMVACISEHTKLMATKLYMLSG